jgi:hypothetical protein
MVDSILTRFAAVKISASPQLGKDMLAAAGEIRGGSRPPLRAALLRQPHSARCTVKRGDCVEVLLAMLGRRKQRQVVDRRNALCSDWYERRQSRRRRQICARQKQCERSRATIDCQKNRYANQFSKVGHWDYANFASSEITDYGTMVIMKVRPCGRIADMDTSSMESPEGRLYETWHDRFLFSGPFRRGRLRGIAEPPTP